MQIIVDNSNLLELLQEAASRLDDTTPLMRSISLSLLNDVEENFAAEGRPKWAGLNPKYAARRKKTPILQVTGQLAASVQAFFDEDSAGVTSNKVYAAYQHNMRNFMPIRGFTSELQPEAEDGVMDVISVYLDKAFK